MNKFSEDGLSVRYVENYTEKGEDFKTFVISYNRQVISGISYESASFLYEKLGELLNREKGGRS